MRVFAHRIVNIWRHHQKYKMRRTKGYQLNPGGGEDFPSARLFDNPLDLEIDLLESVLDKIPDDIQALSALGQLYTQRGHHEKGLEVDRKLCRLRPDDPTVNYNLACSLSLLEKNGEALDALSKAVDLGYSDYVHMRSDKDLDNIRPEPRYKQIVKRLLVRIKSSRASAE